MSSSPTAAAIQVGRPLRRVEDGPLLVGVGRYLDDLEQPGQLSARIVRSHVAHGHLRSIDADGALRKRALR